MNAIRAKLDRDVKLKQARISRRDDVVADRLALIMQLDPHDAPSVESLNHEDRQRSIAHLDEQGAEMEATQRPDRWEMF